MKITVNAGHNPDGMTACGAVGLLKESTESRKIKDSVIEKLRILGHTTYDSTISNGTSQMDILKKIVNICNSLNADLNISIHLNSGRNDYSGDGIAAGTEVWIYPGNEKSLEYAENVVNCLAELGFKNRGVKFSKSLYFLNKTNSTSILIEVCFVDDKDDVNLYNKCGIEEISNAIVKGITGKSVSKHPDGLADKADPDGNWYFYHNGEVDITYTGLAQNKNGWWYIKNGKVDFSHYGLVNNSQGWWYVERGKITFEYNGLATNKNGTWICKNSKVDFNYNGTTSAKIVNGKVVG